MNYRSSIGLTALLCAATCLADLEWESKRVSQIVLPSTESVTAEFKFRNAGDKPVTVVSVDTSCGCTTADLDKKVYEPGESGSIKATMKLTSNRSMMKKVYVHLEGQKERVILAIAAEVPAYLTFDRTWNMWWRGEEPVGKTVSASVGVEGPVNIVSIKGDPGDGFSLQKEVLEPGRRYQLTIKPESTSAQNTAFFVITTDTPKESPAIYRIKAQVLNTKSPNGSQKTSWRERLRRMLPEL
jgi:hypothetical protein